MKFVATVILSLVLSGAALAGNGLSDLNEMTFDCPKAGLNAAARKAAQAPTQGSYQFSYFKIVTDADKSVYEVSFKSNYLSEPDLNYSVTLKCQTGFDPNASVEVVQH